MTEKNLEKKLNEITESLTNKSNNQIYPHNMYTADSEKFRKKFYKTFIGFIGASVIGIVMYVSLAESINETLIPVPNKKESKEIVQDVVYPKLPLETTPEISTTTNEKVKEPEFKEIGSVDAKNFDFSNKNSKVKEPIKADIKDYDPQNKIETKIKPAEIQKQDNYKRIDNDVTENINEKKIAQIYKEKTLNELKHITIEPHINNNESARKHPVFNIDYATKLFNEAEILKNNSKYEQAIKKYKLFTNTYGALDKIQKDKISKIFNDALYDLGRCNHLLAVQGGSMNYFYASNAEKNYKEFAKKNPEDPKGYMRLGQLYFNKGQLMGNDDFFDEAEDYLDKALEIDPKYHEAWYWLGWSKADGEGEPSERYMLRAKIYSSSAKEERYSTRPYDPPGTKSYVGFSPYYKKKK